MATFPLTATVLAAILSAPITPANETPAPKSSLDQLIKDLASPDYTVRDKATGALKASGIEAIPKIRAATLSQDAEVRRRAQGILEVLENRALLLPQRVTLKPAIRSLAEATTELSRLSGYPLISSYKEKVTRSQHIALKDVTYWEAVDQLSATWGHGIRVVPFNKNLEFPLDRPVSSFVARDGAFRIELSKVHEDRDIDFTRRSDDATGVREQKITLTFEVISEPRFILLEAGPVNFETVVDSAGAKSTFVEIPKTTIKEIFLEDAVMCPDFYRIVKLVVKPTTSNRAPARTIRGSIPVRVVVSRKRVVVTDNILAAKGKEFRLGSETLRLDRAELTDGTGDFHLSLSIPPPNNGIGFSQWAQRVSVEDANGKVLESNGNGTSRSGEECHITASYPAAKPGILPPAKLVVEEWKVLANSIRFEFTNVPMP